MRIAVVGAGAMGSLFAARLARAGHAVTLVDVDTDRAGRIGADGLVVTLGHERIVLPVR